MKELELEPDSYQKNFTKLTKGINNQICSNIIEHIKSKGTMLKVLEIGCGPGSLSLEIAKMGHHVIAVDKNPEMINFAQKQFKKVNTEKNHFSSLDYKVLSILSHEFNNIITEKFDIVISNFLLSEIRPLEQQIFLRQVFSCLKDNGIVFLSAEFVPEGLSKVPFFIKRWFYKKKMSLEKSGITHPLKWFENYIQPAGFEIIKKNQWLQNSIKQFILKKKPNLQDGQDGQEKQKIINNVYFPRSIPYNGIKSWIIVLRCILGGQVDSVSMEPGIYKSASPNSSSPIIVTANYKYTFIKVMRSLKGVDAWILVLDSKGINVWCAARGGNFGNKQLQEGVYATQIKKISDQKLLILPQLSAGGVSAPELPMRTENFPFEINYGPVWSESLPEYLKDLPFPKPEYMKIAKFSLSHRVRATTTHISFLFRKIFLKYLIVALLISFIPLFQSLSRIILILFLSIIGVNIFIGLLFPITKGTRNFLMKSYFFGYISMIIIPFTTIAIMENTIFGFLLMPFIFWIGFFSTMSFSGYSMETSPKEISFIYPKFKKISKLVLSIGLVSFLIGAILFL